MFWRFRDILLYIWTHSIVHRIDHGEVYLIQEEFEDTKGVIRIRKSKKNSQHNDQKEKGQNDKHRSTKYTHKTKDRVTRTQ